MDLSKYITSEVVELSRSAIHLASYNPRGCLEGYQSLLANHNTNISKTNKSYLHKFRAKIRILFQSEKKRAEFFYFPSKKNPILRYFVYFAAKRWKM